MEVVRHCFQTEYSQYPRGVSLPGLGDFLRGSCALVPICQRLNLQLTLYFWNHRVGDYLESDEPDRHIAPQSVVLVSGNTDAVVAHLAAGHRDLMTGIWPEGFAEGQMERELDGETKATMRRLLRPKQELQDLVASLKPAAPYQVLHIRGGDPVGSKHIPAVQMRKIEKIVEQITHRYRVYVLSDNVALRGHLCDRYGFKQFAADMPICHLSGPESETNRTAVLCTLAEFFLICGASRIHQLSVYGHGSGLSDWPSKIYDIPIERHKI